MNGYFKVILIAIMILSSGATDAKIGSALSSFGSSISNAMSSSMAYQQPYGQGAYGGGMGMQSGYGQQGMYAPQGMGGGMNGMGGSKVVPLSLLNLDLTQVRTAQGPQGQTFIVDSRSGVSYQMGMLPDGSSGVIADQFGAPVQFGPGGVPINGGVMQVNQGKQVIAAGLSSLMQGGAMMARGGMSALTMGLNNALMTGTAVTNKAMYDAQGRLIGGVNQSVGVLNSGVGAMNNGFNTANNNLTQAQMNTNAGLDSARGTLAATQTNMNQAVVQPLALPSGLGASQQFGSQNGFVPVTPLRASAADPTGQQTVDNSFVADEEYDFS